ncbi:MAG: peptide chain release factor N(5)-glutamine methyltransferase, partial [Pyrinomonadaceae bacterium]
MTLAEYLAAAAMRLKTASVDQPERQASSLLKFVLDRPASFLIAHPEYELSGDEAAAFAVAVERRSTREPFQYIVGRQEFYGLDFVVEPEVLIPRPETEILVEAAIAELSCLQTPRFCEVGVGSGCVSISILVNLPNAKAVGVDVSRSAIAVAERNAVTHNVTDRFELIESDLFANIKGRFDLIVSNPPYIPVEDIETLQIEVRDYEPLTALSGGPGGLDIVKRIISEAPVHLVTSGSLIMEI